MLVSQDSVFPSHDHSHLPSQSVVSAAQMGKYCFSYRRKYYTPGRRCTFLAKAYLLKPGKYLYKWWYIKANAEHILLMVSFHKAGFNILVGILK